MLLLLIASSLSFFSCKKYEVKALGPKPVASFTATAIAGQTNKYLLKSASQNAFRYDWDKADGNGYVKGNETDTVYFADKGDYTVKLFVFGQSGIDSALQVIKVLSDDPAANTPLKMLTNNSSKKWMLAPETGALWIGPSDGSQTWWQNNTADLTTRSCLFNDIYTFSKNGTLSVDTKGDFYVDEEAGNPWPAGMPAVGCYANNAIPAQFQAWTGSSFSFEIQGNDKLKLIGTGAHLGLYKAGTPPDAAVPVPQASVTYSITSISASRLVVKLDYGWGAWRFTYVVAP